ncbi:ATP-binding protein [Streptomyces sp. NBC_00846]|uniref:ATP-binding protein n=1 Tax=Streptomyces sp. NBC_00846 TaxID=2975849 RepID=UPI003870C7FE|nr:ATP-binding protein [Streptomyces sp. NBC_00846]
MDPTHRGPEEYGRDNDGFGTPDGRRRPSGDVSPSSQPRSGSRGGPVAPDFGQQTPQQARVVRLISGDYLLTVNPVDGSEVELCPPGEQPDPPARRTAAERTDRERATAPPVPAGPPAPQLPLLERAEERERLARLLARGHSVRLIGPAGSGRTALLDAVAADCADLAPDGVVRLCGHKRTATDLLYGLFEAVYEAPLHRPDRAGLLDSVRTIGAVVVLDDLEFGGAALEELLDATPECAFLFATTPDVAAPTGDSHLEEVVLAGLGRGSSLELLENVVERALTDEEANWAGDLWFESEGLPLRFVQAGALLRQRDMLRTDPEAYDGLDLRSTEAPFGHDEDIDGVHIPLPSLGEGAAPAALLASRLSGAARDTLRFAVALGGEVPHQAHLPALVGDTHADAALGELAGCGLLSPAGPRYRLAAGVAAQLAAAGYDGDSTDRARTAVQHYAWWAGHPSVTPARVTAEADAIVAAMAQLVPGEGAGQTSAAVLLARSASPALAAGLHWGAWERVLRLGQEAARIAGEVAEEAYFHHELGVLALCTGNPDRARAELETSISMRGALADKSGAVAGRRALALVADRSGGSLPDVLAPMGDEAPVPWPDEPVRPPVGPTTGVTQTLSRPYEEATAVMARQSAPSAAGGARGGRPALLGKARRNPVAVGAGVLLAGVLGTVVALGLNSGGDAQGNPGGTSEDSVSQDDSGNEAPADGPTDGSAPAGPASSGVAVTPGPSDSEVTPSASGTPSGGSAEPGDTPSSAAPSSGQPSSQPPTGPSRSPSPTKPTPTKPSSPSPSPSDTNSPSPTETATEPEPTEPDTSDSASGPSLTSSSPAAAASGDSSPIVV